MTAHATDADALSALAADLAGDLVTEDDEYEQSRRVWNGTINRRPAAVAYCRGAGRSRRGRVRGRTRPAAGGTGRRPRRRRQRGRGRRPRPPPPEVRPVFGQSPVGGGNFGVVTSFEFDCYPAGPEVEAVRELDGVRGHQNVGPSE